MAKFELQDQNGKKFEVEAPDQQSALEAFQQFSQPSAMEDIKSGAPGWLSKGIGILATAPEQAARGIKAPIDWALGKAIPGYTEGMEKADALRKQISTIPSPAELVDKIPTRQAETPQGRYAQTILENAPSGILGIGGLKDIPKATAFLGALPAAASEFVGELQGVKGTALEPWARGGATLATGAGAALAMRPSTATQAISRDLGGLTESQLAPIARQAQNLMQEASQRGVNLTWAQAIEQVAPGATNLPKMQRYIERTSAGANELKPFYHGQPQAMQDAVENTASMIAPRSANPSTIGPAASQEAQNVLRDVEAAINRQTRGLYNTAGPQTLPAAEYAAVSQNPSYQNALRQIRNHPELNAQIANMPDEATAVVDLVRRQLQAAAETAGTSPNPNDRLLGALRGTAGTEAENVATANVPAYAQAQAEQAALRQQHLNPLQQGPIGGVARADSTQGAINSVFPRNPQAGSEGEVTQAITALGRRQPIIPQNIVAQHLRNTANTQMADTVGGQNYYGGARFAKEIAGNPQAERNLQAATNALPQGPQVSQDVQNLVDVLRATGKRLPEGSQTATDLGKAAENTPRMMLNPKRLVDFGEDAYKTWRMQNSAQQTANVLMDPDAIETLLKAARTGQANPQTAILLNMLLSSQPQAQ
jgi:hypothetical protein